MAYESIADLRLSILTIQGIFRWFSAKRIVALKLFSWSINGSTDARFCYVYFWYFFGIWNAMNKYFSQKNGHTLA